MVEAPHHASNWTPNRRTDWQSVWDAGCLGVDQLPPAISMPLHPRFSQSMTEEQFRNTMAVDKKVQDGKLRLILLK